MSKNTYVVQEDSPNLVIVPTDTCYEPSPKKTKLDGDVSSRKLPTPSKNYNNSVFAKKTGSKFNFSGSSRNSDNLIDVRQVKKSPTSWASNFLQSIGGSSPKLARLYSSAPKTPCLRKENTEPDKKITLPNTTKNMNQLKTNTSSIQPIMAQETCLPKKPIININLIDPQYNQIPAHQPMTSKETSQPNYNLKTNQSKSDTSTNQAHVNKLPSLPKNYKIPIHSKCNKPAVQPVSVKEIAEPSHFTKTCKTNSDISKTQPVMSVLKINHDTTQPKYNKTTLPDKIIYNKETICNRPKHCITNIQPDINQDGVRIDSKKNRNQLKYDKEIKNHAKVKELKAQAKNYNINDEQIVQPKSNKDSAQPKKNMVTKEPKYDKEIKKHKTTKESDLPRSYRDPYPAEYNNEITSRKTNADVARPKSIKETYKVKNKKETTYSTKLKTKKEHIHVKCNQTSKITNHSKTKPSQETLREKHHEKSQTKNEISKTIGIANKTVQISPTKLPEFPSKKEVVTSKLKKKRATENNSEAGYNCSENKHHISTEINVTKKKISKSYNDKRSSNSISPIKSVVTKIKSDNIHSLENQNHKELDHHSHFDGTLYEDFNCRSNDPETALHRDPKIDLRTKLKRSNNKKHDYKKDYNWDHRNIKNKFATVPNGKRFVPEENLIISFDAKDGIEEKNMEKTSPVKKLARKQPTGGKKCKKIKLEINIVFDHADTTDEGSLKSEDEENDEILENTDLSFLDDFNIDEIVQSLNECKDSSRNTNDEENLTVHDAEAQNMPSGVSTTVEAMANSQCSELMSQIETQTKTLLCNEISLADTKIKNYLTTELKPTDSENRPCHHEIIENKIEPDTHAIVNGESAVDIPYLSATDNAIVKKEIDVNQSVELERADELLQNKNSLGSKVCIPSSEKTIVKFEDVAQSDHKNGVTMDISQDNVTNEMHVADTGLVEDTVKLSIASSNNNISLAVLAKEKHTTKDSKSIIENQCSDTNNMVETNTTDKIEVVNKETVTTAIQQTERSTNIEVERDVIIINDSDSENDIEIKETQSIPHKSTDSLNHSVKRSADMNLKDAIIGSNHAMGENSESVLILDTDYDIEENSIDNTKYLLSVNDRNANSKNINMTECKINANEKKMSKDDLVKYDKTDMDSPVEIENKSCTESQSEKTSFDSKIGKSDDVNSKCEKTSIEGKTEKSDEIKSEVQETAMQHGKYEKENSFSVAEVADKSDSKPSELIPNSKPPETNIAAFQKCTPKTVTDNAKANAQSAKSKIEEKAQNNGHPQANSENKASKNSIAKPEVHADSSLTSDKFINKLESKLFAFTGRNYTITELMHVGRFSKIYSCKDPRKWDFAIKVIKNESDGFYLGLQKQNMMIKLQNGVPEQNLNCVRLLKGFSLCGLWCFLMEYYPRNLQEALAANKRSFHIDLVQSLSKQLVSAVTILRNNNIIHSDIKPSHILINASKTRIKLCGFDQSSYFDGGEMLPNTGTVNYRAPELILGYPAGYGIDVWSTALVMYEMATNRQLFPGIYNNDILYKQLCTLGSIPLDMLMNSMYRNTHFRGTAFTKIVGSAGQRVIMEEIIGNDRINNILFQTYASEWARRTDHAGMREDKLKLCAFSKLLHDMLVMHPRYRIAIEFVFANPFIYETFDN